MRHSKDNCFAFRETAGRKIRRNGSGKPFSLHGTSQLGKEIRRNGSVKSFSLHGIGQVVH